jgi:hypothetical protein
MPSLARRGVAECLGTAFLLAGVVGSGIMAAKLAGGNGALALLCNTLPTGAILTVVRPSIGCALQSGRQHCIGVAARTIGKHSGHLHGRASGWCDCWRARRARDV